MNVKSTKHFVTDEFGGVNVDWTVLMAGLVGLALAMVAVLSSGIENQSTDIAHTLANEQPVASPFPNNSDVVSSSDIALE